jgi:predicted Fe-Mo cluster-binding NifX family protein
VKVVITSRGKDLDAEVDPRFGRAAYFLIIDSETLAFDVVDNSENANSLKGAGIQAATVLADNKADVLLTGFCGPNAYTTLEAAGIKVANDATGTVRECLEAFKAGKMPLAQDANAEAHW